MYGKVTDESEQGLSLGSALNKEENRMDRMETEVEGFTFGTYHVPALC